MSDFTTSSPEFSYLAGMVQALFGNSAENLEACRQAVEDTISYVLMLFFEDFMNSHPEDVRNGFYEKSFDSVFGKLHIKVPRDRLSQFEQPLWPSHARSLDNSAQIATLVSEMYQNGLSTRKIAEIIEKAYGKNYSAQTVSNITAAYDEMVRVFHSRSIKSHYAVIYLDATFFNLRRSSVSREGIHTALGIDVNGHKEVLDYQIFPSESAFNYETLLQGLKERGLEGSLLFVTDGLPGIGEAIQRVFPGSRHQRCWVHLDRNVKQTVRKSDLHEVMKDLKKVYRQESREAAEEKLDAFLQKWGRNYRRLLSLFEDRDPLFAFYDLPEEIRKSIYTTNLIESSNNGLKKVIRNKVAYPDEASMERNIVFQYAQYNKKNEDRVHSGFGQVREELKAMIEREFGDVRS